MYIYNAKIHTMNGKVIENGYVKIDDGKFEEVSAGSPANVSYDDIDANGMNMYPGFIDAHSHLGIIGDSVGFEDDDCNEATDPVTPQLRTIDGINPFDRCFEEASRAGVTTVLTSPGSANTICGQIYAIKTVGRRVDDMAIKNVAIKFALGENPKSVYKNRDETPITRIGTAALIREALTKARKYYDDTLKSKKDEDFDAPEFDVKSEALIPLFQKKVSAHFHCHRADDICTAIRIAKEFDIKYVLVHATEGYKIADIIAEENAKAIVGPIISDRSKPELRGLSVKNAAIMANEGCEFAICTDHPVIPIQYLFSSAAISVKNGLDEQKALECITINAAKIADVADRVGSIEKGKDADLCLFSGNPLDIMQSPKFVVVNGEIILQDYN